MGYNATVLVLVDRLDDIEKDPEFGKKLATAIRSYSHINPERMPYLPGQTLVINVDHADTMQVVAIGANNGRVLGYGYYTDDDERLLKSITAQVKRNSKK
jgi:hypothetical protein